MILVILFQIVTCSFEEFTSDDYGRKVIKEQQIVARSSKNPVDLIINLNHFETELIAEQQHEMTQFQQKQMKLIEQKQSIKQKIFLSKYQQQAMAEELSVVSKEKVFSEQCYESRKRLLNEESKYIPQMTAIRNDELDKLNSLEKEINQTMKFMRKVQGEFDNIIFFLSKKPDLQEKSGFLSNGHKNKDLEKFLELCQDVKEDIENIYFENPYIQILSSLAQSLHPEATETIELVPNIINKLMLTVQSSAQEQELASNQREELFSLQRKELKDDIDKRSVEAEEIRHVYEKAKNREDQLKQEGEQLKQHLGTYQQELELIQTQLDKALVINHFIQSNYKSQYQDNMHHLEIIRKIKVILNQNRQEYIMFLKQYKQN